VKTRLASILSGRGTCRARVGIRVMGNVTAALQLHHSLQHSRAAHLEDVVLQRGAHVANVAVVNDLGWGAASEAAGRV